MKENDLEILFKLTSNKFIYAQAVNARTIRIQSNASYVDKQFDKNGNISSICFEDKYTISLNDVIKIKIDSSYIYYKIREIRHMSDVENMYILNTHKRTLSSYFILPVLGKNKEYFYWNSYFVNAYLYKTKCKKEKLKHLYLLYRFSSNKAFVKLESLIKKHPMYLFSSNPDKNHIMFVFRIPDNFQNDCIEFLKGKYSNLSSALKRNILVFHDFKKGGKMQQVLNKEKILKLQLEKEYNINIPDNIDLFDRASWKKEIYTDKLKD